MMRLAWPTKKQCLLGFRARFRVGRIHGIRHLETLNYRSSSPQGSFVIVCEEGRRHQKPLRVHLDLGHSIQERFRSGFGFETLCYLVLPLFPGTLCIQLDQAAKQALVMDFVGPPIAPEPLAG